MTAEDLKKIQAFKDQYAAAAGKKDKAAMDAAHAGAEAVRATYGFSGGRTGGERIELDTPPTFNKPPELPTATDNTAQIQATYDNLTKAQTASLNAARDQANSDYQAQIEGAPAQFQPKKDEVDVNTVRQIQALNESAAAKGMTFTGGVQSDMGGIGASGAAQKTALNQQELNVVNSLKKAIADNNRATSFKQVEMTAQNQAQAQQAIMGERNRLDEFGYRRATDQFNQGVNIAGLTGYYGGQRTMQGQQMDTQNQQWQQSFDRGVTESDRAFEYQQGRDKVADEQWTKTFDWNKDRAKVQDGQWLKAFQADQKNAAAGRAIQWAGLQLDRDKFDQAKIEAAKASPDQSKEYQNALKSAFDMMSMTKKGVDADGNAIDIPMYTQDDVGQYVANNPYMTPQQKEAMLRQLGFKP